jgi:general secretion pathway protein D
MSIKPPVICCACVLAAAALTPSLTFAGNTQSTYSQDGGVERTADRNLARRQDDVREAKTALEAGDAAMKQKDYETAFAQYKNAADLLPDSPATHSLRMEALNGLDDAGTQLAKQRISEGRYQDAKNLCNAVLDPAYDPDCYQAQVILAHLEDPDYYNQTITPRFRANVEEVKRLFIEAKGYEDTGRYDKAFQDYEKVLNLDPTNVAARKGEEDVDLHRDQYANEAYEQTRAQLLWKVDDGWGMPVHKFGIKGTENAGTDVTDVRHVEYITNKLNRIIIPKLDFRDATIREAVDFLKQKSIQLDTDETDPTRKGVNIVLQLPTGDSSAASLPVTAPAPGGAAIPGLEPAPVPGVANTGIPGSAPLPSITPSGGADTRITLSLANIPLIEALKYICTLSNLKLKIDPYAVLIVPSSQNIEDFITKEYKVPAGFLQSAPTAAAGGASPLDAPATGGRGGGGGGGTADATGAGSSIAAPQSAQEYLTSMGVQFPPGASASFFPATSRLVVHNTVSNIDLIDAIIENLEPPVPTQVSIEAKFVEIQQQNNKELSMNVLLGQFNLPGQHNIFASGGTTGNGTPTNASDYSLPFPSSGALQEQNVTSGNRSGSFAISADAIDALLFPSAGGAAVAPEVFGLGSVMSDPTFQVVLRALDQKKGVDLLSAPSVTTKSGQRAVIEVVREFRYPTEFDPPQIPQNFGGGNAGIGGLGGGSVSVFPVTPTTPTAFETRNTGVTLEVEPNVGSDNYTIDLNLVPQVVEFEGFINYGSPISTINPAALGLGGVTAAITNQPASVELTPNTINQPIFSTRKVTTEVTVWDGQTVVLGGLMSDDVQKVQDKVPILGDIPLLGRAFRSNVDQHLKTNLVIFVTAHLINPAGDNILDLEDKDETVEPLPLPSVPPPSQPEAPLFQK